MLIDFSKVKETGNFKPLPEGPYSVFASRVEEKMSSTGKDFFRVWLQVFNNDEFNGRYIFEDLYITEAAKPRLMFVLSRGGVKIETEGKTEVNDKVFLEYNDGLPLAWNVKVTTDDWTNRDEETIVKNIIASKGWAYKEYSGDLPKREMHDAAEKTETADVPF